MTQSRLGTGNREGEFLPLVTKVTSGSTFCDLLHVCGQGAAFALKV